MASYPQNPIEKPFLIVGDRNQLNMLSWTGSSSEILFNKEGFYQIKPHSDRFGGCDARALFTTSQSWDQISGELKYSNQDASNRLMTLSLQGLHFIQIWKINPFTSI